MTTTQETINQPWQTISKAAATLVAGETVLVRAGTYNEKVEVRTSGTPGNWITYSAYPGETVIVDGNKKNVRKNHGLIDVRADYIRVTGFNVQRSKYFGISGYSVNQIMIDNNYTYNTKSSGVYCRFSDGILIENNEVELACNGGPEECITLGISTNFEVRNNHVHHNGGGQKGGEGIDAKNGTSNGSIHHNYVHDLTNRLGIYVDAFSREISNVQVYNNVVHDAKTGIAIATEKGGPLHDVDIYNNIVYNNFQYGIILANWLTPGDTYDVSIYNNTVWGTGYNNTWGEGITIENQNSISGIEVVNNIVSDCKSAQITITHGGLTNYVIDNNLIDGYTGADPLEVLGANVIQGDPMFVNSANADLHILSGSPAIDAASAAYTPASDMDDESRPNGSAADIGADEKY